MNIFGELNFGNAILFQNKIFARKIKETTLPKCFIKVTMRPSFM